MTDGEHDPDDNEEHLFDVIRSRMDQKHRDAGDALDKVNAVYVSTPRDKELRSRFDRFLLYVTARQRYGRRGKGNAFFVTGES